MEKVTAYKAFNGAGSVDNLLPVDIVKHIVTTQQFPSSEKKSEVFYVVGGKYRLTGCCKEQTMLHNCMDPYSQDAYSYWGLLDKAVAEYILNGGTIDSHSLSEICERYHKLDQYSQMQFVVIEPLRKWRIEDVRWHAGSIAPFFVIIEKI